MLVVDPPKGALEANAVPKEGDEPRLRIWNPPTDPPLEPGRLRPITARLLTASIVTPQLVQLPPVKRMVPVPALVSMLVTSEAPGVPENLSKYTLLLFAVHTV